jgi:hypothetical protein
VRYVPYGDLAGQPHVVVDGSATEGTVLVLSHWPGSTTPVELAADLSAEIALRYLDRPDLRVDTDVVSNNHVDEDGAAGLFALVDPDRAQAHRELLVEIARAGDFEQTDSRDAARIAFALVATSRPGAGYQPLLDRLPGWLADPSSARELWEEADDHLAFSLSCIDAGGLEIEEEPELELSVVTPRARGLRVGALHPIALHGAIAGLAVLELEPGRPQLRYRYETWVRLTSRRPRPRVDLAPLAARLGELDVVPWSCGDVDDMTPTCEPHGESELDPAVVRATVIDHLRTAPAAWDPWAV